MYLIVKTTSEEITEFKKMEWENILHYYCVNKRPDKMAMLNKIIE